MITSLPSFEQVVMLGIPETDENDADVVSEGRFVPSPTTTHVREAIDWICKLTREGLFVHHLQVMCTGNYYFYVSPFKEKDSSIAKLARQDLIPEGTLGSSSICVNGKDYNA